MSKYYSFHRPVWETSHFSDYKPFGWSCGKCCIGQLRANVDKKMLKERQSKRFVCQMRCTEPACDEVYYVIGKWGKFDKLGAELSIERTGNDFQRWFFPTAFEPTLVFFSCETTTPDVIKDSLNEAFKLYWISYSACVNAIRKVLERLMDHHSIKGSTLDQQLKNFGLQHPLITNKMLAIKLLGNVGSHQNYIERSDALDGFELLAAVLSELFPDKSKAVKLDQMADQINTTKKPRSKK